MTDHMANPEDHKTLHPLTFQYLPDEIEYQENVIPTEINLINSDTEVNKTRT